MQKTGRPISTVDIEQTVRPNSSPTVNTPTHACTHPCKDTQTNRKQNHTHTHTHTH